MVRAVLLSDDLLADAYGGWLGWRRDRLLHRRTICEKMTNEQRTSVMVGILPDLTVGSERQTGSS